MVDGQGYLCQCALLGLLLLAAGCSQFQRDRLPVDLLIINARIVDGTGAASYPGEVAVRGDTIVYVGAARQQTATPGRVIDAANRVVSPGFIDPHSHGNPLETPMFENFLAMGVTTITLGQDGSSPDVDDLGPWLETVEANGIGPNLAMFVGHGTLRDRVGIGRDRDPSAAALARLNELLAQNLTVTFGLSTGLEYNPGLNAGDAEMLGLAALVGERNRVIMSHIRNEDDPVLAESLAELLRQGNAARVHVAHLKSVYGKGARRGQEILAMLESARGEGIEVSADVYPYTASYTGLSLLFPVWAKAPEQFVLAKQTRRQALADYLRNRVNSRNGPAATLLGTAPHAGKTLAELAAALGKPFEDVLIDDLGPQGGSAAYFIMDEALQSEFIRDPSVSICSDGSPTGFHPRGHGTFARIIETHVVKRQTLSLEEAIRKMTSLPAAHIGITDRGTLSVGQAADMLIFDPDRVRETATYEAPHSLAAGFDVVIVNGLVAREADSVNTARTGRVLQPPAL